MSSNRRFSRTKKGSIISGIVITVMAILMTVSEFFPIPLIPSWSDLSDQTQSYESGSSDFQTDVAGDVSVHYIDVGQGDSILIQAQGKNILIDAGENGQGKNVLKVLNQLNVTTLDYVIGTHPHSDHIGGLDEVMRKVSTKKIILPKVPDNMTPTTKTYEDVLTVVAEKKIEAVPAVAGEIIQLGNQTELQILGPVGKYDDLNDYSVVARLVYQNTSFLFTGDAEKAAEQDILKKFGSQLDSDVLKIGHHGSSSSTGSKFFEAVSPSQAIICVGKDNTYGHPHKETLSLLNKKKVPYYTTEKYGTITLSSDGQKIGITTEK